MATKIPWKIFVFLLLFAYVVFVVVSLYRAVKMLDFIHAYPEKVNYEARELEGRIASLRDIMPAVLSNFKLAPALRLEIMTKQWDAQDLCLDEIKEAYRGNPELIDALMKAFKEHRAIMSRALVHTPSGLTFEQAREYFLQEIGAGMLNVHARIDDIMTSSNKLTEDLQLEMRSRMKLVLVLSLLFGMVLLCAVWLVERREDRKNRQIANREHVLNILAQNLDEMFIIANDDGVFQYVSPNSERIIGLPFKTALQKPEVVYNFLTPDVGAWLRKSLRMEHVEEKRAIFSNNDKIYKAQVYNVLENLQPTGAHIIALTDETERVNNERNLLDALETARLANEAKSGFILKMARRMEEPAENISNLSAKILEDGPGSGTAHEMLREISASSRHLLDIIKNARDINMMAGGGFSLDKSVFKMETLIDDVAAIMEPRAQARDLSFEICRHDLGGQILEGDSARLKQILLILLSNAINFTPPEGGIVLDVSRLEKGERNLFRFVVKDSGPGISPDLLDSIFLPFERGASLKNPAAGAGLGLPLAYNLASLMGGNVKVESREGYGTEATLDLPFYAAYGQKDGPAL